MIQKNQKNEFEVDLPPNLREEILRSVLDVKNGSVEIVIQNSKIVQINTVEKVRFV